MPSKDKYVAVTVLPFLLSPDLPKKNKIVYTSMCCDFFHYGHLRIIQQSAKYGKLIVGLMTDKSVASYKRVPMLSYEKRKEVVENIKGVWKVVPQDTLDYTENLKKYKPDIVTNGDDWKEGPQKETREQVIKVLKEWGGRLVEFSYTKGISSTKIIGQIHTGGITTDERLCKLRRMIMCKPLVRVLEAHNGLSALIVENIKSNGKEFDAIWESSLTDSASKGKPDIELVDFTSRIQRINEILEVTTKPIIVDGDTGGTPEHFSYMVKTLERLGVSAVIIEDKKFPKINSLKEGAVHIQEDTDIFCNKLKIGKKSQLTHDFMIIARIESLIMGKPVVHALRRAVCYIDAGVDAIMIHSKDKTPEKILEFCKEYKKLKNKVPLVVVPTSYNEITEKELMDAGVSMVIYANHPLRSAYQAMVDTARTILIHERAKEVEPFCVPVKELLELIK
jgi:phosphoenolpyruvate phosphomutase / 2-hydroxyethylphosphonate cytidylyltransferase